MVLCSPLTLRPALGYFQLCEALRRPHSYFSKVSVDRCGRKEDGFLRDDRGGRNRAAERAYKHRGVCGTNKSDEDLACISSLKTTELCKRAVDPAMVAAGDVENRLSMSHQIDHYDMHPPAPLSTLWQRRVEGSSPARSALLTSPTLAHRRIEQLEQEKGALAARLEQIGMLASDNAVRSISTSIPLARQRAWPSSLPRCYRR
jgi:hypothetical protein